MRILKLKLKNINSLAGENEIDFTLPAFFNDGLFAITGKTGAGKSSILDAISLALYGKTPRVDVSGSENAVMTKGEKDCFAEILFEANGKTWKASWKQEQTKTGNLKPVNRQIADSNGKIIADQVRSCDSEIIKIMGLTFEQFTKVIMLAQGSFTAFLQANKNEKGELLEQITGTEIYGQLSKLVFENSVEEKKKLERLSFELESITILNADEISALEQEIQTNNEEKAKRDVESAKLEKAKNWLDELNQLAVSIDKAKEEIPALEETQLALLKRVTEQKELVDKNKGSLKLQQPIFKKVTTIDTQIAEKENSLTPVFTKLENSQNEQNNIAQEINQQKEVSTRATNELTSKESWAKENQKYEVLVSKFSAFEHENIVLTHAKEEVQSLKTTLEHLKKEHSIKKQVLERSSENLTSKITQLSEKEKELIDKKAELATCLGGKSLNELQAVKEGKSTLNIQIARLIQLEESIAAVHKEIEKSQQIVENTKSESDALAISIKQDRKDAEAIQLNIDLLSENIQLIRRVESLEEHRKFLKDGEPCPLCGAEEHPYAIGNTPSLDDKEAQQNLEKNKHKTLTNSIIEKEKKVSVLLTNHKNASENKIKEEQKLADSNVERATVTANIQSLDKNFLASKGKDTLGYLYKRFEQNDEEIKNINTLIKKGQDYSKEIEKLRDSVIPKLLKEKDDVQAAKSNSENAFQLAEQQFKDKSSEFNQKEKSYEKDYSKFSTELSAFGVTNIEELNKCLENWDINQQNMLKLKDSINALNNSVQLLEKEFEGNKKAMELSIKEKEKLENELEKLIRERNELFGVRRVEEVEQELELAIVSAEKDFNTIKTNSDALTLQLKEISAVLKEKEQTWQQKTTEQLTDKTREEIQEMQQKIKAEADTFGEKIGENRQKLSSNEQNILANQQKLNEKENQQAIYNKWKNLDNLIGSSDGKKYRNFAQALTFEYLIGLANKQLQKMSDRYLLKRVGDNSNPFDLAVIDKFQNNDERTAQNLSGGEKFIVSLSLALGLSSMASKNMRIDTMFIDEGFGTLDSDYLDVALNALSNLQSDGKIIGVISHIAELKERIATHIEIVPSGNGRSHVVVS